MATADDYRLRAEQCRRLAAAITAHDDPAIAALVELAAEHEAKAVALETGPPDELPGSQGKQIFDTS